MIAEAVKFSMQEKDGTYTVYTNDLYIAIYMQNLQRTYVFIFR